MSKALDKAISSLGSLSRSELLELKQTIDDLLEVESGTSSDCAAKGYVEHKMIPDKKRGKEYGPYKYLRIWKDGKLTSKYLGKAEDQDESAS